MKQTTLGRDALTVPVLCLGTMTWGTQTGTEDAHRQIDLARDHGLTFMDTAEMYPVNPVRVETVGNTEAIIGQWLASRGGREDWVIATKIAGEGGQARGGEEITPESIRRALDASLKRLKTEYVDLYQFHWPNRGSYHFRKNWRYDPSRQDPARTEADMLACLETLDALVAEGKIRHWGLSNETAWGMSRWLALAEDGAGPRPVSIQNEYSLMCRLYDTDLAELGHNEAVTLLAYSPLATGLLTGKYGGGATPEGSRRSVNPTLGGRAGPRAWAAADAYAALARAAGLDPAQMAIAFILTRPFPVIPIIGATTLAQLENLLPAADLVLDKDLLAAIGKLHHDHAMPY